MTIGKQVHKEGSRNSYSQNTLGYEEFETEFESAAGLYKDISEKLNTKWDFKVNLGLLRSNEYNQ